jgi:hypothetical protein
VSDSRESNARISSGVFVDSSQNTRISGIGLKSNAHSANVKPIPRISNGLKFIRKSELQHDLLESKSVISIKGEHEYTYRFANDISQKKESCNTIPQSRENNVFDFIAADHSAEKSQEDSKNNPLVAVNGILNKSDEP